jgi:hypothetical protein
MSNLSVVEKGNKFVVTKNGEPILLPKTDGQTIVTEFDTKQDAEKYMTILKSLRKKGNK